MPLGVDYKVIAVDPSGKYKFNLSKLVTALTWGDDEQELAAKAQVTIANTMYKERHIASYLQLMTRIYIYTKSGSKYYERFRGIVWEIENDDDTEKTHTVLAYDRSIYLMKTHDNAFFPKGKTCEYIIKKICSKWGIKVKYSWYSHKCGKKKYNDQAVADIFTSLMDAAKLGTGHGYVFRMDKGILKVMKKGQNQKIPYLKVKKNITKYTRKKSLDDICTKVAIVGSEKKSGAVPVLATIKKNNKKYGTVQQFVEKEEGSTLAKAKKEARNILKEQGKPTEEIEVVCKDVPWIRKGDTVYAHSANLKNFYYCTAVEHNGMDGTMTIDLEVRKGA